MSAVLSLESEKLALHNPRHESNLLGREVCAACPMLFPTILSCMLF